MCICGNPVRPTRKTLPRGRRLRYPVVLLWSWPCQTLILQLWMEPLLVSLRMYVFFVLQLYGNWWLWFLFLQLAKIGARCDYGIFIGASNSNYEKIAELAPQAAGLKMYLNETYSTLMLDGMHTWMKVRGVYVSVDLILIRYLSISAFWELAERCFDMRARWRTFHGGRCFALFVVQSLRSYLSCCDQGRNRNNQGSEAKGNEICAS